MASTQRILGRACDSALMAACNRAFPSKLGCEMDGATDDATLVQLAEKNHYDVFFVAPGLCSLPRAHQEDMEGFYIVDVVEKLKQLHPQIIVVQAHSPEEMIPMLSKALAEAKALGDEK